MTGSLKDELSAALPAGFQCKIRYIHSPPRPCDPLFSPLPGIEPEKTRLASHFLTATINPKPSSGDDKLQDVLVLGMEVLVYSTKHLTTFFVSKADSTGYLPQQRPSPAKAIITTLLKWLSHQERRRHPSRKLVISLFARAQSQYLFPGSAENLGKHVLDDRQLIKWWARVLDPIFPKDGEQSIITGDAVPGYEGYITVPGYEGAELRQFMPSNNHAPGVRPRWKPGNPLAELAKARGLPPDAPPRSLLPRFPDDPKARFMQDLDDEVGIAGNTATVSPTKRKGGKWSTIRDLDRFWEAMEFRQECSSGRLVGFLWLVMRPEQVLEDDGAANGASQESVADAPSSDPTAAQDEVPVKTKSPSKRRRKPLSGPIIPRQPRLKGGSSSLTATSDLAGMLSNAPGDGVLLSKDGYDKAMQTLLHLEFNTLEAAAKSSSKWFAEISSIGGIQTDWALDITGTMVPETQSNGLKGGDGKGVQVNDLGGMVRKKRKANDIPDPQADSGVTVNVLASSMVRKKPKPAAN